MAKASWSDINRQAIYTLSPSVVPEDVRFSPSNCPEHLRAVTGDDESPISLRHPRVCCHAGTCSPAGQRTEKCSLVEGNTSLETLRRRSAEPAAVLAGSLLRFQRIHECKTSREVEIHAPQSRRTRLGRRTGRVGMVQLPALLNGRDRNGAHRELSWNDSGSAAINSHISESRCGAPRLCQSSGRPTDIRERNLGAPCLAFETWESYDAHERKAWSGTNRRANRPRQHLTSQNRDVATRLACNKLTKRGV